MFKLVNSPYEWLSDGGHWSWKHVRFLIWQYTSDLNAFLFFHKTRLNILPIAPRNKSLNWVQALRKTFVVFALIDILVSMFSLFERNFTVLRLLKDFTINLFINLEWQGSPPFCSSLMLMFCCCTCNYTTSVNCNKVFFLTFPENF